MFKKKILSLILAGAMVFSMMPANVITKEVNAASTWRSALYPENWQPGYTNSQGQFLHDFSYAGYEKGEKDVPTEMSGLYADVTNYGADNTGTNDATSAIQSAINAVEAAGGGTVYLPAGTYKVKPSSSSNSSALRIKGSNILFKGAGVGKTFIRCYAENMRYCQVINVSPSSGTWDSADDGKYYYLSQDVPETPTTTIHLSDVGSLKAGDWVIIRSDRTQSWIDEHSMGGFWYASVNPTTMGTTFYRQITSVNTANKTIEIDIPTRYYMKTRDNARVYKVTPKQSNVGLTDFSIGNKANSITSGWGEEDYSTSGTGAYNTNNAFLIKFSLNINCFAKNISTYQAGNASQIHMSSNGLDINKTRNLTVDTCDFSYPQYEGGGGNGYGMNICGQETLIKNCSSTSARHSFSFKYSYANGNVIYHYTSTDPKYGSDFHMYLSMSNLIDNEELNGDFVESNIRPYGGTAGNRHGYTSTQTVFWNTKGNYYKSGSSYIIDSRQYGYGYIIGTQGSATAVKTTPTTMSSTYGSVNTAPEDYKEGIGTGATLSPQSLYYDQLERRLSGSSSTSTKEIPGTFNATDYNSAGSEISTNTTASGIKYVGNLVAGSSLEYKANIAREGKYSLEINAVSGNNNQTRTLSVYSGDTLLTTLNVVNTTDWEDFQKLSAEVNIPASGEQTLKIVSSGSVNISDITITKMDEITLIPGTISIKSYNEKTDSISFTTEGGVTYAGNLHDGSYLDYKVTVPQSGDYTITLKLAAGAEQYNAKNMLVKVDDATVATIPIQGSSSWTTFIDHSEKINFANAGTYKLTIASDGGACNVTDLVMEKVPETETTTQNTDDKPEEVFGVVVNGDLENTIHVVWGRNEAKEAKGQTYNVYVDGIKKLSNVGCDGYDIKNISGGTHTVKVTSVLGEYETEGFTTEVTVKEQTIITSAKVEINGCQISTVLEGYRVVYSVSDPDGEVASAGLVYGLADYAALDDMVVDSSNNTVHAYEATDAGKLDTNYGSESNATSFAMTMQFVKTAEFYNSKIYVRAYAKLKDGSYIYSDNKEYTIYDVADYLYQNEKMTNLQGHDYLYNSILKIVSPSYEEKAFNLKNIFVRP